MGVVEIAGASAVTGFAIGGLVVWVIKRLVNGTLRQNAQLLNLVTTGMAENTKTTAKALMDITAAIAKLTACIDVMKRIADERHSTLMHTLDRIEESR